MIPLRPALVALALAVPAVAVAQTTGTAKSLPNLFANSEAQVTADKPEAIAALMQKLGYRAALTTDDQGDPKIDSSAGGANFSVYFYGCQGGANCASIQFSAGFDLNDGTTYDVANDWNTRKRYGKVYLDNEGDPYIELDVNLAGGGIPEAGFADTIDIWDSLLSDFQTHINW